MRDASNAIQAATEAHARKVISTRVGTETPADYVRNLSNGRDRMRSATPLGWKYRRCPCSRQALPHWRRPPECTAVRPWLEMPRAWARTSFADSRKPSPNTGFTTMITQP